MAERPLAIGLGNELRGDDGAGPRVVELLAERGLEAIRCDGEPISLLEIWQDAKAVLLVDAVAGPRLGRIWRWEPGDEELPVIFGRRTSTHLLGLAEVLQLAEQLDRLPEWLTVIGIEGGAFELGTGLSRPVERATATVAAAIAAELEGSAGAQELRSASRTGQGALRVTAIETLPSSTRASGP